MTTTLRITTTNGNRLNNRSYSSEAEAQEAIRAVFGSGVYMELCGDRWLVWASEEDYNSDDNNSAVIASIA